MSGKHGDYLAFDYRIYDARLGRFLSIDPLSTTYPWNSPYAFAENDVISSSDLEGAETLNKTITKDPNSVTGEPGKAHICISMDYFVVTRGSHAVGDPSLIDPAVIRSYFNRGRTSIFMSSLPTPNTKGSPLTGKQLRWAEKAKYSKNEAKRIKVTNKLKDDKITYYIADIEYDVAVIIDDYNYETAWDLTTGNPGAGMIMTPHKNNPVDHRFRKNEDNPELSPVGGTSIYLSPLYYSSTPSQSFGVLQGNGSTFMNSNEVIAHGFGHNSGAVADHNLPGQGYTDEGLQSNEQGKVYPTRSNTLKIINDSNNRRTLTE